MVRFRDGKIVNRKMGENTVVIILGTPEAPKKVSKKALLEVIGTRAARGDIESIVVASRNGKTALELAGTVKGVPVISVTEFEYKEDVKKDMKKLNIRSLEKSPLPVQDLKGVKDGLMVFGSGAKSAVEVSAVAADKGLVKGKIIAVAGGKGIDTALVVRPSTAEDITNPDPGKRMSVLEVLAFSPD